MSLEYPAIRGRGYRIKAISSTRVSYMSGTPGSGALVERSLEFRNHSADLASP